MSKFWIKIVLCIVLVVGLRLSCQAQTGPLPPLAPAGTPLQATVSAPAVPAAAPVVDALPSQILYDGTAFGEHGVGATAWGGGTVSQDDTNVLGDSKHSVLVESPGFYQGGSITFAQPVSLGDPTDKTKYLQLSIMLRPDPIYPPPAAPVEPTNPNQQGPFGQQRFNRPPGMNGPQQYNAPQFQNGSYSNGSGSLFKLAQMPGPNGMQGFPPGGMNGNPYNRPPMPGMPGQPGFPNQQGSPSTGYQPDVETAPEPLPASSVHLTLTFADGTQTDIKRILPAPEEQQEWINIGVPISKLVLPASESNPSLASLTVCTDSPCLVNVGRIRVVTDSTSIVADAGGEKDIAVDENAVFKAQATGGASMLSYQWDFDTKGAFVPQADGPWVKHSYPTGGVYTVTLVVSDVDGIKAPSTSTATVHVEQ